MRSSSGLPRPPALPSLHGLRVFETVARHMSFTEAARELAITQTAVSHQIRALEAELSSQLFQRFPRRIELTDAGKAWALELSQIFARLHAVNRELRRAPRPESREVTISVVPSFAARWLVPRLGRFLNRHQDTELRISTSERVVDLVAEGVDLGVRYGFGRYEGLVTQKLAEDSWVVVCAPALLAQKRLRALSDLANHVLLRDDAPEAWQRWLRRNGATTLEKLRYTELTDSSMLVEAAVRGQGVGLARWSLAVDEIAGGRLVTPFPKAKPLATGPAYYLAASRQSLRRPAVRAFRDWLVAEAEESLRVARRSR